MSSAAVPKPVPKPVPQPVPNSSSKPVPRSEFWSTHFTGLAVDNERSDKKLDFSNERVMIQNFAFILESLGDLVGKRVVDCACGSGTLTRLLHTLGAEVHGFDFVQKTIDEHRSRFPDIHWTCDNLEEWAKGSEEASFDIVIASEVLQYVDFETVAQQLHRTVRPGGRLVITIPNSDCPIVRRAAERFDGRYLGISLADIVGLTQRVFSTSSCLWRGVRFREDQTLFPYEASPWCDASLLGQPERANRIQLVVQCPVERNSFRFHGNQHAED